jgi:hypothetical protein
MISLKYLLLFFRSKKTLFKNGKHPSTSSTS